jgi:hypothetical protein
MDGHREAIWLEQFCKQNVPAGQTTDRDFVLCSRRTGYPPILLPGL